MGVGKEGLISVSRLFLGPKTRKKEKKVEGGSDKGELNGAWLYSHKRRPVHD